MAVYTSGDWRVKLGRDKEFVEAWRELADWSGAEHDMGGWAKLLRDKEDPGHFRSVGEWTDQKAIERWRASEGFKERFAKIRVLLDDVHIYVLDPVVEIQAK